MKKVLCLLLVLVLTFGITGCGATSSVETEGTEKAGVIETDIETKAEKTSKTSKSNEVLYDGVYFVGDDIKPGSYIFDVTSEYTGYVVCFESKETYETYKANNGYTVGENATAIGKYALYDFYVYGDQCYLSLKDGNVLMLEDCNGPIKKLNANWYEEDGATMVDGVYFQGQDIDVGRYVLSYLDADYSVGITVFENLDKYGQYHKSPRSTGGEESEAVDKFAMDSQWLYDGDTCSISVKEGGVVIISGGSISISM